VIFDANAFIGKWPWWPVRAAAPREVAAELAGWGIERAAVCSTRAIFVHCGDGNRETAAAADELPGVFTAFACAQRISDLPRDGAFRGLRLYPQHHSFHPLYDDFADEVLEDAAARRWPVLLPLRLIMNWGMPMLELGVMEALVERHPRVRWILAGINYLYELELAARLMRRFDTVHLETSCVMGYQAVENLVARRGADRLLFGSGAPFQHGAAALSKIVHARIPDAARELILGGNLCRLLEVE
jgi:hypothetical protein